MRSGAASATLVRARRRQAGRGRPRRAGQLARARGGAGRGLDAAASMCVRVGLGPTPMLYYAEAELDVDGGIMITGSHNPADYNGFKMVAAATAFFGADIQRLGAMAAAGDWDDGPGLGLATSVDIIDPYVERLIEGFRRRRLPDRLGRRQRRRRPGAREARGATARRASSALHRRRRPLSQPPSRSRPRKPISPT